LHIVGGSIDGATDDPFYRNYEFDGHVQPDGTLTITLASEMENLVIEGKLQASDGKGWQRSKCTGSWTAARLGGLS
jgi:hypothetical protein